jgi:transposase
MDEVFAWMCEADARGGRPSVALEKLVRALLLQVLYSIRSERMLMEQIPVVERIGSRRMLRKTRPSRWLSD